MQTFILVEEGKRLFRSDWYPLRFLGLVSGIDAKEAAASINDVVMHEERQGIFRLRPDPHGATRYLILPGTIGDRQSAPYLEMYS